MQAKIRDAQLQKVPYMLIAGDRDVAANAISVRTRANEDLGAINVDEVIARIAGEAVVPN
jgi:threonyl-tRNA synthetase